MVGVPPAGGAVEVGHPVRLLGGQTSAEGVGEQVVVAVPATLVVEGDDEQVVALQRLEHRLPVGRTRERVAQRAGHLVQEGRLEHEAAHVLGLAAQHLLDQVVEDEAMAAGERLHERRHVVMPPQRERRELESGGPALRPRVEGGDVVGAELEPHHAVEERVRLVDGEAEVGDAQLEQLAAASQSRQSERRVRARGDRDARRLRQVLDEERHRLVDLGRVDHVVVVERENGLAGQRVEVVDEARHCRFARQIGLGRVQRHRKVTEEATHVVVGLVQRQPRDTGGGLRQPLAQQRRLAEAGRRRDEDQPRGRVEAQPLGQARAGYELTASGRDAEFRAQHRHRHEDICPDRRHGR